VGVRVPYPDNVVDFNIVCGAGPFLFLLKGVKHIYAPFFPEYLEYGSDAVPALTN